MRPEQPVSMCRVCVRHRFLRPLRRRWPLWLALGGLLFLFTTRFVELRQLGATLAEGNWPWLLVAALLQVAYYVTYAALYKAGYAVVGVAGRVRELVPVMMASIVVATLVPAGGISAAAVMIDDAGRRGQPAARATEGVLLVWVAGVCAVLPLLAIGLGYLYLLGALEAYQVVAAAVFALYVGGLLGMLFLALWQPEWLRLGLEWVQGLVDRVLARFHRATLAEGWAERNAAEATGAAAAIATRPRQVGATLAVALGSHLLNLASLFAIFLAFDHVVSLGPLAAAYALGFVLSVISVIPFDLGVMAGVMTVVYASIGVPTARALVISVAFRGLNAWLPVALGFLFFRRLLPQRGTVGPEGE